MARLATTADNWSDLEVWLGSKQVRKIANNTYARWKDATRDIAICLHSTDVVTFHDDGTITLNSGGYRTVTTKDRINGILPRPLGVYSNKGVWTLYRKGNNPCTVSEFYDGMRFTTDGDMVTDVLIDSGREMARVKKEIGKYVKLYTDDVVMELVENAAENGTAGDCLVCHLGHDVGNTDHLELHIEEGYVMASLMVNALRYCGYGDMQIPVCVRVGSIVRRAMRRYMVETMTVSHGARPVANSNPNHWG